MSKQTNLKPKEWYEEYFKEIVGYSKEEVEELTESAMETDKMMDYLRIIYERLENHFKTGIDYKYDDIPKEAREMYHGCRIADEYFQLETEWNTIEDNKRYLDRLKNVANLLKEYFDVSYVINMIQMSSKALEQGYLITNQLSFILMVIEDVIDMTLKDHIKDVKDWEGIFPYIMNEGYKGHGITVNKNGMKDGYVEVPIFNFKKLKAKLKEYVKPMFNFEISEERLFSVIKKEVKWYNKERDIEIFKERGKGRLLEDLAEEYHIDESTVSTIAKKVQGAVNYYKGKLFEKEYHKYLKSLNKYDKVILEGASGKADIYAYDEENDAFYIFSLKYYEIKKRPYHIKVKEFKSELKLAYESQFDYKDVKVYLIVFDLLSNTKEEKELDFRNPKEIVLD